MKWKETMSGAAMALAGAVNGKFFSQFGFYMRDVSLTKIVDYMYEPKDSSSLAVTRILFGLAMLFDIPSERGGAAMEKRWGDPNECHFPLFPFLQAIPMPYMAIVYAGLWLGALGIMLGYKYRISAAMFTTCYWYLFLIEKSYWNNHSYLFGLVALLLTCTEANCYWSIDVHQTPCKSRTTVPYWNYFILKYQFFILYFMAGMKKGTTEWLTGYAMRNLSEHWVFAPFKLILTVPQIDYFIVHWFIFVFDLTIAMWMMWSRSRHIAMAFCALFHLMNSRLFRIGMFPWACLATMPLFYPFDWPKLLLRKFKPYMLKIEDIIRWAIDKIVGDKASQSTSNAEEIDVDVRNNAMLLDNKLNGVYSTEDSTDINDIYKDTENFDSMNDESYASGRTDKENNSTRKQYKGNSLTLVFIIFYMVTQAFLPYSHFVTTGYNNWKNGLYGYSWDMMVHNWETFAVTIKVVDNEKQTESYIDPYAFSPTGRWTTHGDMVHQYAKCFRERLVENANNMGLSDKISQNLSIYVDVWCSMNNRVTQRHYDPKVDILKAEWSPFKTPSYVMPLLNNSLLWRKRLNKIRDHILLWSNRSDVVFLADFPGYEQEKFISTDLRNVSLTVLDGEIVYQPQVTKHLHGQSFKLSTGENIPLDLGTFHKVYIIGDKPAYYMYTFYNSTDIVNESAPTPKLAILKELLYRFVEIKLFVKVLVKNLGKIVYVCAYEYV